jgi:hypothetical protein
MRGRKGSMGHTRTIRRRNGQNSATSTLHFEYEGGAYIDVSFDGASATDVINVYDYAAGRSTVATRRDFERAISDYLREMDYHDLLNHAMNSRYYR